MLWEHALLAVSVLAHLLAGMSMFLAPPRADDGAGYRLVYAVCNAVAMNFRNARNAARPEPKAEKP